MDGRLGIQMPPIQMPQSDAHWEATVSSEQGPDQEEEEPQERESGREVLADLERETLEVTALHSRREREASAAAAVLAC
ncbi:hypothetical protein H920_06605 [Fukomys damarensis]|uniref:Uncharacterized protein n=1 Tax=Fukomys damarensis TaxID=885580 RepID=A0A091E9Y6_FUKDA|nr:hypothetical protein H920_06605 [Fukomys damarensis]